MKIWFLFCPDYKNPNRCTKSCTSYLIYLPMFPNSTTATMFHDHGCERFFPEGLPNGSTKINRLWYYNWWDLHVHNVCITKLWSLSSNFLSLHVFLLKLFSSIKLQFSMLFHVSNSLQTVQTDWVESSAQSSLII